ncbi:MAG: hypothetical protein LBE79_05550 [Tannerella sp.]|jgi:hypothetical protein|nr:hypothetical protein [Tannerella sp.]
MKTVAKFFLFFIVLQGMSCSDSVKDTVSYMANVPVYMSHDEFKATTKVVATRPLMTPGKICLYGNYLFINEIGEGIHVIDNTDPSSPRNVAFIEIMGNIDLAAKDGILYADNLVDMLLFDISNPASPKLKSRVEGAFEGVLPNPDNDYPVSKFDTDGKVVVGWTQEVITEEVKNTTYYPRGDYLYLASGTSSSWSKNMVQPGANITGVNGSMSRFAIAGKYLYAIYIQNLWNPQPLYSSYYYGPTGWLKIFDTESEKCEFVNSVNVSTAVETIFAYNDHLFLGMSNGMQILSIENPTSPVTMSYTWHFWGCDPVVVSGDYAYLTVRSTNVCGRNGNMLQVIDISDISQPKTVSQYTMQEPYGLGIDNNKLFVCDNGLKVFDATVPVEVGSKLLFQTSDFHGFDLIPYNNLLLVIGSNGLYQYSYANNQLNRLSVIPVSK